MKVSRLRIIHTTLGRRAEKFNYNEFPKTLYSLTIENPSKAQINKGFYKINSHYKHPIFIDYVPTYSEMIANHDLAWLKRYSISRK